MHTDRFRISTNGKLRSTVLPGGQGGLDLDWVALTRFHEGDPLACGPAIFCDPAEGVTWSVEVAIPPNLNVELRRITLVNRSESAREIELTTYAEVSLNHPLGDAGHPAFSKLFIQTAFEDGALLARRRPRGANENWPWMGQSLVGEFSELSWETNRATFLGRGRCITDPAAMDATGPLAGETGNVLDPVMAWRCKVTLEPASERSLWLLTAAAPDEAGVQEILRKTREADACESLWIAAQAAEAARISAAGLTPEAAARYQELAGAMLLGNGDGEIPATMAGSSAANRHPLAWDEIRVIAMGGWDSKGTRQVMDGLPYWKSLGLKVRVFVMDDSPVAPAPADVTIVSWSEFSEDELAWWLASAQLLADANRIQGQPEMPLPLRCPAAVAVTEDEVTNHSDLLHFNGFGGFSPDGKEYVIPLPLQNGRLRFPPMPWINVLANPDFGCIVSERGAGYTWSRNSQANRLTPWSNDPIRDPHGEAFYLRDDRTGDIWSPLPGPCAPRSAFTVRHGFGRSSFHSRVAGLVQTVEFLVPPDDNVKLVSFRLRNDTEEARELTFASYQKLLLCANPDRHHAVLAWCDPEGVQHAENPRAGDFAGGRVFGFVAIHGAETTASESCHSTAIFQDAAGVGALSCFREPGALPDGPGFGRDACFARMVAFTLEPGAEVEIISGLGEVMAPSDENRIINHHSSPGAFATARSENDALWERLVGGVKIETPLPEVDVMVNGWLLYQNIGCRIWGRSAFYQSGGAYGFRDQLQDSGALAALHPEMSREQILIHAAQQFPEGDVTHWWHPAPMNRGMRTKFADDLLWLPFLTGHYLDTTGDASLLEEFTHFIEGPQLAPGEDETYMQPVISKNTATVFEHCCLAIDKSLTKGVHGLPLMGIGDWNDGMSRIGREGKGESVWMGFFLYLILERWIPLCASRGESERVKKYTTYREDLLVALNDAGWDGEWYRRAYYDDGTPLGTHTDDECRIDALAQAWAVISRAAPPERAKKSLDSLERELVDREADLIRLLHPPFVDTPHDPGYIKGYVAGVRENGGQYTHAACWVVRAMAEAGRRTEAAHLLQKLSPVWHARDSAAVALYQVEPYVVAADIYGADPHIGRGGWTWYTGSAGWMFRVAVESVLGLTMENGDTLVLAPRVPDAWKGFKIHFRTPSGKTIYYIEVIIPAGNAQSVAELCVDGQQAVVTDGVARWAMTDDAGEHTVVATLGPAS